MRHILLLLVVAFSGVSFSETSFIEKQYNAFNLAMDLSSGDIESTGISLGGNLNVVEDILIGINYTDLELDEIDGIDVGALNVDGSELDFTVGRIFKNSETVNTLVSLSIGQGDVEVGGIDLFDYSTLILGASVYNQVSEQLILNFGFGYNLSSSIDLNETVFDFTAADERQIEDAAEGDVVLNLGFIRELADNISLIGAFSTEDFDVKTFRFGFNVLL